MIFHVKKICAVIVAFLITNHVFAMEKPPQKLSNNFTIKEVACRKSSLSTGSEKNFNRLAILIDELGSEYQTSSSNLSTLASELGVMIHQSACPIIVSQPILSNFLQRKYTKRNGEDFIKAVKFNYKEWDVCRVPGTTFFVLFPLKKDSYGCFFSPCFYEGKFCYEGKKFAFPLLKIKSWTLFDSQDCDESDALDKGAPSEIKKLYWFVDKGKRLKGVHSDIVNVLERIFTFDQDLKKLNVIRVASNSDKELKNMNFLKSFSSPWTMYISGHGLLNQVIAGLPVKEFSYLLKKFDELNIFLLKVSSCEAGGKNREFFIKDDKGLSFNVHFPVILNSISDASTNEYFYIKEGFPCIDKSTNFKLFFETVEKVAQPNQKEKKEQLIESVLRALSLFPHWFYNNKSDFNSIPQVLIPRLGCFHLFSFDKDIIILGKSYLQRALCENRKIDISDKKVILFDQALVPLELTICSSILDNHRIYQDGMNQVFPTIYDFSLKKDEDPVRCFPIIVSTTKEDTHIIESIVVEGGSFLQFIRDSFFHVAERVVEKTFYIKEVVAHNDVYEIIRNQLEIQKKNGDLRKHESFDELCSSNPQMFYDVLIMTSYNENDGATHIGFSFEYKGEYWSMSFRGKISDEQKPVSREWDFKQAAWNFTKLQKSLINLIPLSEEFKKLQKDYEEEYKEISQRGTSLDLILKKRLAARSDDIGVLATLFSLLRLKDSRSSNKTSK